jgi:hypothetical protein
MIFHSVFPIDQPAQIHCETCADNYCEVCFAAQHRKGSRKLHATKPLSGELVEKAKFTQNGTGGTVTHGDGDDENVRCDLLFGWIM